MLFTFSHTSAHLHIACHFMPYHAVCPIIHFHFGLSTVYPRSPPPLCSQPLAAGASQARSLQLVAPVRLALPRTSVEPREAHRQGVERQLEMLQLNAWSRTRIHPKDLQISEIWRNEAGMDVWTVLGNQ